MLKVTVLYNLPDSDLEAEVDTQKTAIDLAKSLHGDLLGIHKDEIKKLLKLKTDFVFNLIEWAGKESELGAEVITLLEKVGIPYSGSDARGYYLSCNKEVMKNEMMKNNIPTPKWQVIKDSRFSINNLKFPVIAKPVDLHCGIGIGQNSLAQNETQLRSILTKLLQRYDTKVLIEEFIDGRELHITILEKNGKPWVLPAAEVIFEKKPGWAPILSYDGKWNENSNEYSLSTMQLAKLDLKLELRIKNVAKLCYEKLGGRDYPRIDVRIRGDEIYVLEINNNPGIDYDILSGIGVSARAVGLSWKGLLMHIVKNAYIRSNKYDTAAL